MRRGTDKCVIRHEVDDLRLSGSHWQVADDQLPLDDLRVARVEYRCTQHTRTVRNTLRLYFRIKVKPVAQWSHISWQLQLVSRLKQTTATFLWLCPENSVVEYPLASSLVCHPASQVYTTWWNSVITVHVPVHEKVTFTMHSKIASCKKNMERTS